MSAIPESLEDAIAQSREATKAAISDGFSRLQIEIIYPELKAQYVAEQFIPAFDEYNSKLKVFFTDTGAAALAKRDWPDVPFIIEDLGSQRTPIAQKITDHDSIFLIIEPSVVEVSTVEKLCNIVGDRPVVLLIPRLEDAFNIGIGYNARQIRDRFLSQLESCYYLRAIPNGVIFRCYPWAWQVWQETEDDYELLAETSEKPTTEALDQILYANKPNNSNTTPTAKSGFLASIQQFFRALSR